MVTKLVPTGIKFSDNSVQTTAATGNGTASGGHTGEIIYVTSMVPPAGYLKANGVAVSRVTYSELFATIGSTFGAGDGSTTFNLPDLRGEFIRGADDARGVDAGRSLGTWQKPTVNIIDPSVTDPGISGLISSNNSTPYSLAVTDAGMDAVNASDYPTTYKSYINGAGASTMLDGGWAIGGTRPRNIALLACICYSGSAVNAGPQGPAGPAGSLNKQLFTTSGTWTCPAGITSVYVSGSGGGGGGAGIYYNGIGGSTFYGGGGGGGSCTMYQKLTVTPGTTYNITIGGGGYPGGNVGADAVSGGVTSFGVLVSLGGGGGATGGSYSGNGAGGAGGINAQGGYKGSNTGSFAPGGGNIAGALGGHHAMYGGGGPGGAIGYNGSSGFLLIEW